ncbi:auxin-responsive protein SAUR71-like [Typha angustifolia]|uniref:auxin-responsive protein SAUR71-like n=1 Tax=Typha angustifolia TaxID=59011 RepID=UPI003C2B88F5
MRQMIRRLSRVADSSSQYQPLRAPKDRRRRGEVAPEGHVPVYVGEEMERFVVRAELLGRPAFAELLRQSAQEYGYEQRGVLRIPCPVPVFRRVLDSLADSAFDDG